MDYFANHLKISKRKYVAKPSEEGEVSKAWGKWLLGEQKWPKYKGQGELSLSTKKLWRDTTQKGRSKDSMDHLPFPLANRPKTGWTCLACFAFEGNFIYKGKHIYKRRM